MLTNHEPDRNIEDLSDAEIYQRFVISMGRNKHGGA